MALQLGIGFVRKGQVDLTPLTVATIPLSRWLEGCETFRDGRAIKVIMHLWTAGEN